PSAVPAPYNSLRINEFMASNQTALADPDEPDQFPDWIEIYNPNPVAVNLANQVAITDDAAGQPARWPFTRTLVIPAQGFLVIYADDDPDQGAAHVGFALSAAGEELGLTYTGGGQQELIDRYEYAQQSPNVSEGRRPDGGATWVFFSASTPGQSNDLNPPNISNVTRDVAIPQAGNPVQVSATITDNGTIVSASLLYTTSVGGGEQTVAMSAGAGNLFTANLPGQATGVYVSYRVRAEDNDGNIRFSTPSGYQVGYVAPVLVINEVVAKNSGKVEDPDEPGDHPDWLEIYNPGPVPVQMKGLSLTDNPREPEKFTINDSISLPVGGFLMVYLDEDPEESNAINVHTNFRLSDGGEFIGLFGGRGTVLLDGFAFGQQLDNVAIGRFPDGDAARQVLLCTTPGRANILCVPKALLPAVRVPGAPQ
ncbi:MAG: lamin tail domain-containing protein, partial [Caldilineaceae bacterium]